MIRINCFRIISEFRQRLLLLAKNSNIHGLKHVVRSRNVAVKCLWVVVLVASAGCLALLLAPAARAGSVSLSYNPDTRYVSWTTTFPAVTVCETFHATSVQRKFTESTEFGYLMKNLSYNYGRHLTNLLYGVGACTKEVCVPCGAAVPCRVPWRQIIEQIHLGCSSLLGWCAFNGVEFECCARFRGVDAEHGACYSFNSLQTKCAALMPPTR